MAEAAPENASTKANLLLRALESLAGGWEAVEHAPAEASPVEAESAPQVECAPDLPEAATEDVAHSAVRKLSVENYLVEKLVGRGHFAKVYKCIHRSTGAVYALKVVTKKKLVSKKNREHMQREIAITQMLEHPHVVAMHKFMESPSKFFIALEFVGGGSLKEAMQIRGPLSEPLAKRYASQLFDGLGYCHAHGVCHRDLKPENLLLDAKQENLKITDFGLANFFADEEETEATTELFTRCGSPYYVAPEVIYATNARGYEGNMADLWSCGVILYEILNGVLPFATTNYQTLYKMVAACHYVDAGPKDAAALIRKLLCPVSKRIALAEIGSQPWFKDIKSVSHAHKLLKPSHSRLQNAIQTIKTPVMFDEPKQPKQSSYRCDNVEIKRKKLLSTSTMHSNARVSIVDNHLHVLVDNKVVSTPPFPLPLTSIQEVKFRQSGDKPVIKMELRKQNSKTKVPKKMFFVFHDTNEAGKSAARQLYRKILRNCGEIGSPVTSPASTVADAAEDFIFTY